MNRQGAELAAVFIGTVIGAGFASGQELQSFFLRFSEQSYTGIIVAGVLFALVGIRILLHIYKTKDENLTEYLQPILGRRVAFGVEIGTQLFLLSCFCVMAAGSGALFSQQFGWEEYGGILVFCAVCIPVFLSGGKGIITLNALLVPIMIAGILWVGVSAMVLSDRAVFGQHLLADMKQNPVLSAIVFVSYNTLTLVPVLAPLRNRIDSKKTAVAAGMMSGAVLLFMMLVMAASMLLYTHAGGNELPFLYVAQQLGRMSGAVYFVILLCAVLTTAATNGFGFIERFFPHSFYGRVCGVVLLLAVSVPVAMLGFSGLVRTVYTLFGYLGLGLLAIFLLV